MTATSTATRRGRLTLGAPALPPAAGPLSERVVAGLADGRPPELGALEITAVANPLCDDDFQLALYVLYELHYRGFAGVDERLEWDPALLGMRAALEAAFEAGLRTAVPSESEPVSQDIGGALRDLVDADDGPSLSRYIETRATEAEFLEFVIHRSAYQLKEADPHSWAIPRLAGPAKAALVEVQADEYGGGAADRVHATLFQDTMEELELDGDYGAYLDRLPGVTLATVNLMSLFGLHRRLRGSIVGHLAAFEMSSSLPNRRYSNGLQRLGASRRAREFYDEHVVADAVHENIAAYDLAGGLSRQEPDLAGDIMFGARALIELDGRFAAHLLDSWAAGRSSLREPAG